MGIIFDKSLEEAHFCNMYAKVNRPFRTVRSARTALRKPAWRGLKPRLALQLCNVIKDVLPKFDDPSSDQDPVPVRPDPAAANMCGVSIQSVVPGSLLCSRVGGE